MTLPPKQSGSNDSPAISLPYCEAASKRHAQETSLQSGRVRNFWAAQIASLVGDRYLLEGSIRISGNRIRATAQLIDASSGNHVWAELYDRSIADLFQIPDELTAQIIATIDFEVRTAEAMRPRSGQVESQRSTAAA